jgi:hypothetical protein
VTIRGTVRESLSQGPGAPIGEVHVRVLYKSGPGGSATSDAEGNYRIEGVAPLHFHPEATRDGYESVTETSAPLTEETTLDLALRPVPRTLIGPVTETFPTETTPIAGATIEIVSGANMGRRATTDADGSYSLSSVWAPSRSQFRAPNSRRPRSASR